MIYGAYTISSGGNNLVMFQLRVQSWVCPVSPCPSTGARGFASTPPPSLECPGPSLRDLVILIFSKRQGPGRIVPIVPTDVLGYGGGHHPHWGLQAWHSLLYMGRRIGTIVSQQGTCGGHQSGECAGSHLLVGCDCQQRRVSTQGSTKRGAFKSRGLVAKQGQSRCYAVPGSPSKWKGGSGLRPQGLAKSWKLLMVFLLQTMHRSEHGRKWDHEDE